MMAGLRARVAGSLILLVCGSLALSACGSRKGLKATPGMDAAPVAYGMDAAKTPDQMMAPTMQARPDRSAEPLTQSQTRPDDPFDLPPR